MKAKTRPLLFLLVLIVLPETSPAETIRWRPSSKSPSTPIKTTIQGVQLGRPEKITQPDSQASAKQAGFFQRVQPGQQQKQQQTISVGSFRRVEPKENSTRNTYTPQVARVVNQTPLPISGFQTKKPRQKPGTTASPVSFDCFRPIVRAQGIDEEEYYNGSCSGCSQTVVRGQPPGDPGVPPVPPPLPPPPGVGLEDEAYNCGNLLEPTGSPSVGGFFTGIYTSVTTPSGNRGIFQSDHMFNDFISPFSNPFYFEDPRALTEGRLIYFYQRTPGSNPKFAGGNLNFFGLQARLAFTEQFSFVIHKLGWLWQDANGPDPNFSSTDGFTEVWFGPKFTFIRNDCTGTLLAGGLIFEIPAGPRRVFQSTGNLSLAPYLSFGQAFLKTTYGQFHWLSTIGYSFGVDSERSDHFYWSNHLDFDIGNYNKFYPFVELNWFAYTANGGVQDINFEGRDVYNFGSRDVSGNQSLSITPGFRYKFNRHVSLGAGVEFYLLSRQDIMDYRFQVDFILRY